MNRPLSLTDFRTKGAGSGVLTQRWQRIPVRVTRRCTVTTREVVNGKSVVQDLEFAEYDSLEESCRDYAWLITRGAPYQAAWEQYRNDRDLPTLVASVARAYAPDPGYAHLATLLQTNVKQAIAGGCQDGLPEQITAFLA